MRKYSFILFLFVSHLAFSQHGLQMSQYMMDKYQINPAYAGMDYSLSVTGVLRSQYSNIEKNPTSQWINAHLPFYKWNGAIGVQISNDALGLYKESGVHVSYNYILDTPGGLYSAGIKIGGLYARLSGDQIITPEGNYEGNIINHNDPTLSSALSSGIRPNIELGFYVRNKYFEGGINITDLYPSTYTLEQTQIKQLPEIILFAQKRIKYLDNWEFIPSLLFKTDNREIQTDLNLMASHNGNVFGGLGIRGYSSESLDAISFMVGLQLNTHYTLSYSLDIGASNLRNAHEGSHEIILNYNLNRLIGVGSNPKIIYNPRHL